MIKFFYENQNNKKGAIAIILTLLIMGVTLLIAFGLSTIFVNEIKNSNLVGRSGPAFYAADAGAEYALYQIFKKSDPSVFVFSGNASVSLYNAASYNVSWNVDFSDLDDPSILINSIGGYLKTKRAVELIWGP